MPDLIAPSTFVEQYKANTSAELISIRNRSIKYSELDGGLSNYRLSEKIGPDSLAEQLDNSSEATGAMIFIKTLQGGGITAITNNFYLVSLSFSYKERVQLMENFNSANVAFFGETAKVYQLQGVALDYASTDAEDPGKYFHQSGLIDMYNTVLRGSKLVEKDSIAVLKVLNHTIEGYPLNLQVAYSSQSDKMAQFSMSWVVTRHDMVMENYLTNTRLKNFYSVTSKKDKSTENINKLITFIDEFLNLKYRTMFTDKFTNEDLFFDWYGTSETEYIMSNIKASNNPTNPGIPVDTFNAFLSVLSKYLVLINTQKAEVAKTSNVPVIADIPVAEWVITQEEIAEHIAEIIAILAKFRMDLVISKVNNLYFGPVTKAVLGTHNESSSLNVATAASTTSMSGVGFQTFPL